MDAVVSPSTSRRTWPSPLPPPSLCAPPCLDPLATTILLRATVLGALDPLAAASLGVPPPCLCVRAVRLDAAAVPGSPGHRRPSVHRRAWILSPPRPAAPRRRRSPCAWTPSPCLYVVCGYVSSAAIAVVDQVAD
uniref:Uncharacterized protein n=1 Tax=Oryza sativa subsp. japonica TaxID=39947 RepID=Q7XHL7_ORYSJ|nr:hypothetical protein [Oryza sativa Japonica Group]